MAFGVNQPNGAIPFSYSGAAFNANAASNYLISTTATTNMFTGGGGIFAGDRSVVGVDQIQPTLGKPILGILIGFTSKSQTQPFSSVGQTSYQVNGGYNGFVNAIIAADPAQLFTIQIGNANVNGPVVLPYTAIGYGINIAFAPGGGNLRTGASNMYANIDTLTAPGTTLATPLGLPFTIVGFDPNNPVTPGGTSVAYANIIVRLQYCQFNPLPFYS